MDRLNELLRKQHIRYRMRMNYIGRCLRWPIPLPWEMRRE